MTSQDYLLFVGALAVMGGVGYALGMRQNRVAPPAETPTARRDEPTGDDAEDDEDDAPAVESEAMAASVPEVAAIPEAAPVDVVAEAPEEDLPVIKLFDTDEEEEADITRVGSLTVPAPRTVLQAPVVLIDEENAAEEEPASDRPYFLISATAQTDKGLRRKQNEDSLLVNAAKNLFVVADGMGGHNAGELASRLAVQAMEDAFATGNFEGKPHSEIPAEASELARAIQMANATIFETAQTKPELMGMGTTLCCARFSPTKRRMQIGHVGDSRCYRFRDGRFRQLTADHTMADLGMTGPESANLSRAVGIWAAVPIDIILATPAPDDIYLLCSDGLTKMLDDDRIAQVLRTEEDPQAAVDRLIFFANAKGGKDNITVILIRVVDPSASPV
jgi:serine/threonine protein phosphatase PrpC